MKKLEYKNLFLEELRKTPVISAVCLKLNISRQTIYRWLKEDSGFAESFSEALRIGVEYICDLAETKLISRIDQGDFPSIKYWLDNNKKTYLRPRPVSVVNELLQLQKEGVPTGLPFDKIQIVHTREEVEFLEWREAQEKERAEKEERERDEEEIEELDELE